MVSLGVGLVQSLDWKGTLVGFHLATQFLGIVPNRNIIQSTYKNSTQQLLFLLTICKVLGPVGWVTTGLRLQRKELCTLGMCDSPSQS